MQGREFLINTVRALQLTIDSSFKVIDSQARTIQSLEQRIKELSAQVAYLNRQLFGRKSEKLHLTDPLQLDLFAGTLPENAAEVEAARDEAVATLTKEVTVDRKQERRNRTMMETFPCSSVTR